ncbi:MAG: transglutaminase-like domain-containing protein [archaeon]
MLNVKNKKIIIILICLSFMICITPSISNAEEIIGGKNKGYNLNLDYTIQYVQTEEDQKGRGIFKGETFVINEDYRQKIVDNSYNNLDNGVIEENLEVGEELNFSQKYDIIVNDKIYDLNDNLKVDEYNIDKEYYDEEEFVEEEINIEIKDKVEELTKNDKTVKEKVESIRNFISSEFNITSTTWFDEEGESIIDINKTFMNKSGTVKDHINLFTTMLKIANIPSRTGVYLKHDIRNEQDISALLTHCTEIYDYKKEKWIPFNIYDKVDSKFVKIKELNHPNSFNTFYYTFDIKEGVLKPDIEISRDSNLSLKNNLNMIVGSRITPQKMDTMMEIQNRGEYELYDLFIRIEGDEEYFDFTTKRLNKLSPGQSIGSENKIKLTIDYLKNYNKIPLQDITVYIDYKYKINNYEVKSYEKYDLQFTPTQDNYIEEIINVVIIIIIIIGGIILLKKFSKEKEKTALNSKNPWDL